MFNQTRASVESVVSTDARGCSIKHEFAIIHPAGEEASINISPWNWFGIRGEP
jgi:hypothetical protein